MAREPRNHDIWIAFNGQFGETLNPLRDAFAGLLPESRLLCWNAPADVADNRTGNRWRRMVGERLREAFLAQLNPDIVLVSSLFEGLDSNALTSVKALDNHSTTAVSLYDLIPHLHRDVYLTDAGVASWYEQKLDMLRRADLWLAISESSRVEGIEHLSLPAHRVFNVSSAAGEQFRPIILEASRAKSILGSFGITRPFLMYTGGIDHRKNIERLIRAYAQLPIPIRREHQLAIVCSASESERALLQLTAAKAGLQGDELVLTGYILDSEILGLYNLCKAFVFPSWHEGFGLPALEAMSCGAAVVAANTSSLPEVVGLAEALFDPFSEVAIAQCLQRVLTDTDWRTRLKAHGLLQAQKFTWSKSAGKALDAFEAVHEKLLPKKVIVDVRAVARPRLAYLSPLPPQPSGIADYSAELLPELSRHYDIDVVVADVEAIAMRWREEFNVRSLGWFDDHASQYDRILYHFGNSEFHQHMFALLQRHPGTVVLHDFFLSGSIFHSDVTGYAPGSWVEALYSAHGYPAVRDRRHAPTNEEVIYKYPANLSVLQQANGIIVHSAFSKSLAKQWYGAQTADQWTLVPFLRQPPMKTDKTRARSFLGIADDAFVVCSFGIIAPTKLSHRILSAWQASHLARDQKCHLVFVGENAGGDYGVELKKAIGRGADSDRVAITGYASPELYRNYLAAADAAIQLRTRSRGETSGAVLDCMAHGIATIVNAHGSLAEAGPECVMMLADDFEESELISALHCLYNDQRVRQGLGERSRERIVQSHLPRTVADQYRDAIEHYATRGPGLPESLLVENIARIEPSTGETCDWASVAGMIAHNHPARPRQREMFYDVSAGNNGEIDTGWNEILIPLLSVVDFSCRVEPVYIDEEGTLRYARRHTLKILGCPEQWLSDDPVDAHVGDVFLTQLSNAKCHIDRADLYGRLLQQGVKLHLVLANVQSEKAFEWAEFSYLGEDRDSLLKGIAPFSHVICGSPDQANRFLCWLSASTRPGSQAISVTACDISRAMGVQTGLRASVKCEAAIFLEAALGLGVGQRWLSSGDVVAFDGRAVASHLVKD